MSHYIFLMSTDPDDETIYAIRAKKIESMNLCDTYDQYGQKVGHQAAGDYHPDNLYTDAETDCLQAVQAKFDIDVFELEATIEDEKIVFGDQTDTPANIEEINEFVKAWIAENATFTECRGFDYWDGHNWRSVIVECELMEGAITHLVIDDLDHTIELCKAIEERVFVRERCGYVVYHGNGYVVTDNRYQSSWAAYEITQE